MSGTGILENTKWRKCFLSIRDEIDGQFSKKVGKTVPKPTTWGSVPAMHYGYKNAGYQLQNSLEDDHGRSSPLSKRVRMIINMRLY